MEMGTGRRMREAERGTRDWEHGRLLQAILLLNFIAALSNLMAWPLASAIQLLIGR